MRSYTKIPANKPPPKKKMVRPMPKISTAFKGGRGFRKFGD